MTCNRRQFFSDLGRSIVSGATDVATGLRSRVARGIAGAGKPWRRWLRPPGALPEPRFLSTCTRCTACADACPYESIRRLGPEFGPCAGTPAIIPDESPCCLCQNMPCIAACEPGALLPCEPSGAALGTAVLDVHRCYVYQGQPCDYCVTRCPLTGRAIAWGAGGLPAIDSAACAGCGVCVYLCPADALSVEPATHRRSHRSHE